LRRHLFGQFDFDGRHPVGDACPGSIFAGERGRAALLPCVVTMEREGRDGELRGGGLPARGVECGDRWVRSHRARRVSLRMTCAANFTWVPRWPHAAGRGRFDLRGLERCLHGDGYLQRDDGCGEERTATFNVCPLLRFRRARPGLRRPIVQHDGASLAVVSPTRAVRR
jgi:hypothetical protein